MIDCDGLTGNPELPAEYMHTLWVRGPKDLCWRFVARHRRRRLDDLAEAMRNPPEVSAQTQAVVDAMLAGRDVDERDYFDAEFCMMPPGLTPEGRWQVG